jgi:prophage tail gpP-like protein
MADPNLLTLRVGGQVFAGWKAVSIKTGIEQLAGTYELGITERWPNQTKDWFIPPGELCQVQIGDDTVISGYVDVVSVTYDAGSHEIKVNGRDKSGDLVDCSAPAKAFSGQTFEQIATALCTPFGIEIFDETVNGKKLTTKQKKVGKKGTPPKKSRVAGHVPKHSTQSGESIHRTLEKLARSEGVLMVSDGEGGLLLTRAGMAGNCGTILEQGANILRASFEHSHAALYSEITVKAQASGAGDAKYDVQKASPKGVVKRAAGAHSGNSQITRYRPLIIVAETQADATRCQQRAEWEASNREAKSRKLSVTVQGWRESATGDLWRINRFVRVRSSWLRVDEWWLIAAVTYKLDESGTTAELSLVSDKAFDQLPEIPEPKAGAGSGKYQVKK